MTACACRDREDRDEGPAGTRMLGGVGGGAIADPASPILPGGRGSPPLHEVGPLVGPLLLPPIRRALGVSGQPDRLDHLPHLMLAAVEVDAGRLKQRVAEEGLDALDVGAVPWHPKSLPCCGSNAA